MIQATFIHWSTPGGGLGIFTDKNQRISGVYFGVLNFENLYFFGYWSQLLYFLGLLNKRCILKCFICSTVFFWFQFYSPGASIINHGVSIIAISCLTFTKWVVLWGYFLGLCFRKVFFFGGGGGEGGFSVSGKAFLGSFRNAQLRWPLSVGLSSPTPWMIHDP